MTQLKCLHFLCPKVGSAISVSPRYLIECFPHVTVLKHGTEFWSGSSLSKFTFPIKCYMWEFYAVRFHVKNQIHVVCLSSFEIRALLFSNFISLYRCMRLKLTSMQCLCWNPDIRSLRDEAMEFFLSFLAENTCTGPQQVQQTSVI